MPFIGVEAAVVEEADLACSRSHLEGSFQDFGGVGDCLNQRFAASLRCFSAGTNLTMQNPSVQGSQALPSHLSFPPQPESLPMSQAVRKPRSHHLSEDL